jgi:hypothetical protein
MKLFLKTVFTLFLAVLVLLIVYSAGTYVFHHTHAGVAIMTAMLEWGSTSNHWMVMVALVFCLGGYSAYELLQQSKRRANGDRRLTPRGQMGHLAIYLSFACLIWAAFGRVYHH